MYWSNNWIFNFSIIINRACRFKLIYDYFFVKYFNHNIHERDFFLSIVLISKNNSPSTVEKTNYFERSTKFKLSLNFRLIMAQWSICQKPRTSFLLHWSFILIIVCFIFLQVVNSAGTLSPKLTEAITSDPPASGASFGERVPAEFTTWRNMKHTIIKMKDQCNRNDVPDFRQIRHWAIVRRNMRENLNYFDLPNSSFGTH